MEDIMHIQTPFLRNIISMAVGHLIRKKGFERTYVELNDLRVSHVNCDRIKVHLDIDAEIDQGDLMNILYGIGVLGKGKWDET